MLAEKLTASYEVAAQLAGRLSRSSDRSRSAPLTPAEVLVTGADDPERSDRQPVLQSILLDVTHGLALTQLRETLRAAEDWEGLLVLRS